MEQMVQLQHSLEEGVMQPAPVPPARPQLGRRKGESVDLDAESAEDPAETRSTRSASTTSRSASRLSLTLPIVPPNAFPSRPTPTAAVMVSLPPTPLDTPSSLMSPLDPNDFITAIAAQERRVLELRETLGRAESDLARLKKQWTVHEAHKKRAEIRNVEPLQAIGSHVSAQAEDVKRRSMELDRRKALLLGQHAQNTPERSKRRMFSGAHTRTLSLLSPTRSGDAFSAPEDEPESPASPQVVEQEPAYSGRGAHFTASQLAKRASWAPRSVHQTVAMKQMAEDLKAGFWTFMEDIRQATVGDEPITGQRTSSSSSRSLDSATNLHAVHGAAPPARDGNQDTIRPSNGPSRPRLLSAFEGMPVSGSRHPGAGAQRSEKECATTGQPLSASQTEKAKSGKQFSWTPLTMDAYDDNDWSNWDDPAGKSPRWSGSTVNGDVIPAIPEKADENETSLYERKASTSRLPSPSRSSPGGTAKLEELLPPVFNRLTPSNLKKTASDFMTEWEKSLSPPESATATATATTTAPRE